MINSILTSLKAIRFEFRPETEGQGLVEYALILLLIAIGCLVTLGAMADAIIALWNQIADVLVPAMGG